MLYKSFFKDIKGYEFTVWIDSSSVDNCNDEVELTLSGTPVVIKTESNGLFDPIKPRTCTINIESDGGLFDLYTTDPQGVKVIITSRDTTNILFKGYVTPMQYGQDWTTIDTLSLECVDMISTLKEMPYVPWSGTTTDKRYIRADLLISYVLSHVADEPQRWFKWYWPYVNYYQANDYTFSTTYETLKSIKFNEANFFDDDDEETPWSFYDVLTEICKYFHVSAVPYQDGVHFIDYVYAASQTFGTYSEWEFTLDGDITLRGFSKNSTWNDGYVAGTTSVETDDFYNIINENTNRYDLDEIASDIMDHKSYHISITKEREFGDGNQVYTWTKEHFFGADEHTYKYAFKTFCRLNTTKSKWTHHWYSFLPYTVNGVTTYLKEVTDYFDGETHYFQENNPSYHWINIPENEYINTMGAEIVHYAVLDSMTNRPTKLDWNDVVMFQCAHPAMRTASSDTWGNFMYYDMFDGTLEKEALSYNSDYELCFSPKDGTSWIVFNAKLYYQQDVFGPGFTNAPMPIDFKELTTSMIPFDNLTDIEPYDMAYTGQESGYTVYARRSSSYQHFGEGFPLLKIRLRIGDKYWDGTQWTTTNSTFYMNFAKRYTDKHDVEYEAVRYYDWLDAISNSDYESKVGAEGYCIPIQKSDCVCGDVHIDIFMPMMMDRGMFFAADRNDLIPWYQLAPVVFMKDFKVDYVYTDESEWYLNEEVETDDVKYCNETKDTYKYEKNNDLKINSWQTQRPISKSFPIVNFIGDGNNGNPQGVERCEYLVGLWDYWYQYTQEQEYNLIGRELRHYEEPRIVYNANRGQWLNPWCRVQLSDASEISDLKKFVVDTQEYDVREHNNRVRMVEFGDATVPSA